MSLQRHIFAYLTVEEREPKRSGLRLIDWAAVCGADGVIIPRLPQAVHGLLECFIERARAAKLRCYIEHTGEAIVSGVDGHYVAEPDAWSRVALERLTCPMLSITHIEQTKPYRYRDHLPDASFLYVDHGQPLRDWLVVCQSFQQEGRRLPGYLDDTPGFTSALERSAYAPLVVKRLALSRSRAGSAQNSALLPHEFSTLVQVVRGIREQLAALGAERLNEVTGKPLAGSAPAAKNGRMPPPAADIAVVIRSKNEARWIGQTLEKIADQSRQPKEVVLVDNESTDGTVDIARGFMGRLPLQIATIRDREFSFGRALNRGIERTTASWVVSLAAHSVPVNAGWLEAFERETRRSEWSGKRLELLAGVYGRQEPIDQVTSDFDKRDLWTTFGAERRLQGDQDFFFHNANSMIRRSLWETFRFNEAIHGVEDRDWAKTVLAEGHVIVYAPLASVYHHHGIHQGRNEERAKRVVRIIELIQQRAPAESLTQ